MCVGHPGKDSESVIRYSWEYLLVFKQYPHLLMLKALAGHVNLMSNLAEMACDLICLRRTCTQKREARLSSHFPFRVLGPETAHLHMSPPFSFLLPSLCSIAWSSVTDFSVRSSSEVAEVGDMGKVYKHLRGKN